MTDQSDMQYRLFSVYKGHRPDLDRTWSSTVVSDSLSLCGVVSDRIFLVSHLM